MNIKFSQVRMAIEQIRDKIGSEKSKDVMLDISMVEDDPGAGKMLECMTLRCTTTEQPSKYDSIKSPIVKEYTVEVFAESENRPSRLTINETRDLEEQ